ncbi:UDP-glucose 4-epimerase GalE [Aristophania vespae]|uniref:UDP-glucose 4-epimerase n=1 Tax=Aristophania vespae TaxID=2697033 RepID=A0A6P1NIS3_9PROT|nr:UDP-glucose 4-epimerase GalE [Aristophania vespae]QHI95562.1 UDP-glucose 4-epimerase GalE [Aristophania vespae]
MRCLVTGGAGFIGSHVTLGLVEAGHEVVVIDNLLTGHEMALPPNVKLERVDLNNAKETDRVLSQGPWDVVLHFAALSSVADSIKHPTHYLRANIITSLNLIRSCIRYNVKNFVFSSTASIFGGENFSSIIPATAPIRPSSPYGESKFYIEQVLKWADRVYNMRYACLRYFNAAGADIEGRLGEDHQPETHLIPLAIDALLGLRPPLKLYGNNYPTHDGTCIRDYVHVTDLADAHIRVIEKLKYGSVTYNLGSGKGFSNLEIIREIERISGKKLPWSWAEPRPGDSAFLVADSRAFQSECGWQPRNGDIGVIIESALNWRKNNPYGYKTGHR